MLADLENQTGKEQAKIIITIIKKKRSHRRHTGYNTRKLKYKDTISGKEHTGQQDTGETLEQITKVGKEEQRGEVKLTTTPGRTRLSE